MDLVLGVLLWFSFLFFLSNPSIVLVALVGFGSEGLDHFVWSFLLDLVHRFEFPTVIRGIEVGEACYSSVHCVPKSLCLLGALCTLDGLWCHGVLRVVKLRHVLGAPN